MDEGLRCVVSTMDVSALIANYQHYTDRAGKIVVAASLDMFKIWPPLRLIMLGNTAPEV